MRTDPTRDPKSVVTLATIVAASFLVTTACSGSSHDAIDAPAPAPSAPHIWSPETEDGSGAGGSSGGAQSSKKSGATSSRDGGSSSGSSSSSSSGGSSSGGSSSGGAPPGNNPPGNNPPANNPPGNTPPAKGTPNPMCSDGAFQEVESNDTRASANEIGQARSFCGSVSAGDLDHATFVLPADAKSFSWGAIWSQNDEAASDPKFSILVENVVRGPEEEPPVFPGKRYVIRVEGTSTSDYEVLLEIVR